MKTITKLFTAIQGPHKLQRAASFAWPIVLLGAVILTPFMVRRAYLKHK